jgi:hypothetical protein
MSLINKVSIVGYIKSLSSNIRPINPFRRPADRFAAQDGLGWLQ